MVSLLLLIGSLLLLLLLLLLVGLLLGEHSLLADELGLDNGHLPPRLQMRLQLLPHDNHLTRRHR